jgi:hypothetical protein
MKFIIISTLLLALSSCASGTINKKVISDDNKPAVPSAISTSQNIEISQLGF